MKNSKLMSRRIRIARVCQRAFLKFLTAQVSGENSTIPAPTPLVASDSGGEGIRTPGTGQDRQELRISCYQKETAKPLGPV